MFEEGNVVGDGFVVAIFEDDGYDIVGVGADPVVNRAKVFCYWA